ncbi:MAG: hypothetical protein ACXVAE_07890, partial [Candidatus Limnocylindrales bacterium]
DLARILLAANALQLGITGPDVDLRVHHDPALRDEHRTLPAFGTYHTRRPAFWPRGRHLALSRVKLGRGPS